MQSERIHVHSGLHTIPPLGCAAAVLNAHHLFEPVSPREKETYIYV